MIIFILGLTLLNSNEFGADSLFPYFMYCFFTGVLAFIVFCKIGFSKNVPKLSLKIPLVIFIAFCTLIWLSGYFTDRIVLPHFYWVANCLFVCSVYTWLRTTENKKVIQLIFGGIMLFAVFESLIVLLQLVGILETQNYYFLCTGSWNNPNVTAIYLALCFYAFIVQDKIKNVWVLNISIFIISLAIVFLFCRTAYLVSLVFFVYARKDYLLSKIGQTFSLKFKGPILATLILLCLVFLAFSNKATSTFSRIEIWKKSFAIIKDKPIMGNGFGLFEKAFNTYQIDNPATHNRFVSMPYNDFLELAVEGGLFFMLLWISFLFSTIFVKNKKLLQLMPLFLSIVIIQLTNFGFNAYPCFYTYFIVFGDAYCN